MTYVPAKFEVATSNSLEGDSFTKKYILWPWGSRSHKLSSALYIIWPIHLQGLGLLHPAVKEEMHLQENTLFNFDFESRSHKYCWVPSTPCGLFTCKFWDCYVQLLRRICIYKKMHYLTFELDVEDKVAQNVAQHLLYHAAYSPARLEVAVYW